MIAVLLEMMGKYIIKYRSNVKELLYFYPVDNMLQIDNKSKVEM